MTTIDNWSGSQQVSGFNNDPLVEQINIIKSYIKQARDAMRFEEVETLEYNLRELQHEFYLRQEKSQQSPDI
jgi:rabenosyn-5